MDMSNGISRRRMLQMTGILGAGAVLAGCSNQQASGGTSAASDASAAASASASESAAATTGGPIELTVYDPTGNVEISQTFAPRLDSIDGKTIAFVADDAWEDVRTFELIKELIETNYPSTKIITQENFIHGIEAITKADNGLPEAMQEAEVDAVIVGNAG